MELTIGELTAGDLTTGFLESLSSLAAVDLTSHQALEIAQSRQSLGIRTFVARLADGRVVGTASLLIEPKFIHGGGRVGHVEDVAVHPEFQKHGIGAALVRHITEEARKQGCYKVILSCYDNLIPFYQQLGYRRHDVGMRLDW